MAGHVRFGIVALCAAAAAAIPLLALAPPAGASPVPYCPGLQAGPVCFYWSGPAPMLPNPILPYTSACPSGYSGSNVSYVNDTAGACYHADVEPYECAPATSPTCFIVSTNQCQGQPSTVDPSVAVEFYTAGVCAVGYHTAERPAVWASVVPCPGGTDPTVYVNNGWASFCLTPLTADPP